MPTSTTPRSRRRFGVPLAIAAVLAMAACGSDDAASGGATDTANAADASVQRIGDIGSVTFDLLGLGVTPVGTAMATSDLIPSLELIDVDPEVLAVLADTPALLDPGWQLLPETVQRVDPEVLVGRQSFMGAIANIDQTKARVVAIDDSGDDWRQVTRDLGAAVGRPDEADALIAEAEAAIDELGAAVAARGLEGRVVSVLQFYPGGVIFANMPPSFPSQIIAEAGLAQPPGQSGDHEMVPGYVPLNAVTTTSAELLGEHDGDVIINIQLPGSFGGRAPVDDIPTFAALDAVQRGAVMDVNYLYWFDAGASGALQVARDLRAALDLMDP